MLSAAASAISLKGSVEIIVDYFFYAINSILYQREIYPEAAFKKNMKYELSVLVAVDEELIDYLKKILDQVKVWLLSNAVHKLVLVVKSVKTGEVLERWQFDMIVEKPDPKNPNSKSIAAIQDEIRGVIRQIVATNTFLPILNTSCTFELLIYTDLNADVPNEWEESGPQLVKNSAEIKLRSFSTTVHRVEHMVSYKVDT
ncbi:unnamed protein product [Calicophoron daubneyi]|uniref:Mitotic spindle assembly checkpoint protein MAD2A n=1 Tax=Calicophoron daubneyi TaxID=300641 RepID=A0AAV2TXF9_CALDB